MPSHIPSNTTPPTPTPTPTFEKKWWKLVGSSELVGGASHQTLDATIKLNFVDGQKWTVQLREISGINKSVTFEVIVCEPGEYISSFYSFFSMHSPSMYSFS